MSTTKPEPQVLPLNDSALESGWKRRWRVWYEDETKAPEVLNLEKPALLAVFTAAHDGKAAPDNMSDFLWLAWHTTGRVVPFAEWQDMVEELEPVKVERLGKAG